jgi:hypothetical protein
LSQNFLKNFKQLFRDIQLAPNIPEQFKISFKYKAISSFFSQSQSSKVYHIWVGFRQFFERQDINFDALKLFFLFLEGLWKKYKPQPGNDRPEKPLKLIIQKYPSSLQIKIFLVWFVK